MFYKSTFTGWWLLTFIFCYVDCTQFVNLITCSSDLYQLHVLFGGMFIQSYIYSLLPQRRAALQQRLSGDITDQDRRLLQGELEEVEGKIKKCVSEIQWCERRIHNSEKGIAEIRGEAVERLRKEGEGSKELYSTVSVDAHSCNHSYL